MAEMNGYTIEHGMPSEPRDAITAQSMMGDYQAWQDRTRASVSDKKSDKKSGKKPVIFSASDLRRREFAPIHYVVPGYLAEGCTLLAGRPKLGKSWLVLDIALAVAHGGECLGNIACEEGDVLYLALEDNERRLQRRIDKVFGIVRDWPPRLDIATEWPRSNEGGIEAIREWILSKEKPRLVIVDVLAMFKPVRGDKESLYEADYLSIKGLQALAGEFGVAIVVVHHTRKSGTEADPFEKVSGTLGLSGAADTTVILDRDGNGATLYGRGRDVEEIEEAVAFSKDTCRWTVQGKAEEVRRSDERSLILDALKDAEEPMGPREIAIATAMPRNNVDQLLFKLAKAGEVRKIGRGVYVHPDRADLIAAHEATPDKNGKKIRNPSPAEGNEDGNSPSLLTDPAPAVRSEPAPADQAPQPGAGETPFLHGSGEPEYALTPEDRQALADKWRAGLRLDQGNDAAELASDYEVEEALGAIQKAKVAGAPEWPALLTDLINTVGEDQVKRLAQKIGLEMGSDDA